MDRSLRICYQEFGGWEYIRAKIDDHLPLYVPWSNERREVCVQAISSSARQGARTSSRDGARSASSVNAAPSSGPSATSTGASSSSPAVNAAATVVSSISPMLSPTAHQRERLGPFAINFVNYESDSVSNLNLPFQWYRRPLVYLYVIECEDVDQYRSTIREKLKQWMEAIQKKHMWMVVHVTSSSAAAELINNLKLTRTVFDRLKSDVPKDRILQVRKSGEGWQEFVKKLCDLVGTGFVKIVQRYGEEVSNLEKNRNVIGWNFCQYFVVKEALGFMLAKANMIECVLGIYSDLKKTYMQLEDEGRMDHFIAPPPSRVNGSETEGLTSRGSGGILSTLSNSDLELLERGECSLSIEHWASSPLRALICHSEVSEVSFLRYLYARQLMCYLLIRQEREALDLSIDVLQTLSRSLRENVHRCPPHFRDEWLFSTSIAIADFLKDRLGEHSTIPHVAQKLGYIYAFALKSVIRLGECYVQIPARGEMLESLVLHRWFSTTRTLDKTSLATLLLLASKHGAGPISLLRPELIPHIVQLAVNPDDDEPGAAPARDPSKFEVDALASALQSRSEFESLLRSSVQRILDVLEAASCHERYQNQLRNLLATYELYFGNHQKAEAVLRDTVVLYEQENWFGLSTATYLHILECCRRRKDDGDVLKCLAKLLSPNATLTERGRSIFFESFTELCSSAEDQIVCEEHDIFSTAVSVENHRKHAIHPVLLQRQYTNASEVCEPPTPPFADIAPIMHLVPVLYHIGDRLEATLSVTSQLPFEVNVQQVELCLEPLTPSTPNETDLLLHLSSDTLVLKPGVNELSVSTKLVATAEYRIHCTSIHIGNAVLKEVYEPSTHSPIVVEHSQSSADLDAPPEGTAVLLLDSVQYLHLRLHTHEDEVRNGVIQLTSDSGMEVLDATCTVTIREGSGGSGGADANEGEPSESAREVTNGAVCLPDVLAHCIVDVRMPVRAPLLQRPEDVLQAPCEEWHASPIAHEVTAKLSYEKQTGEEFDIQLALNLTFGPPFSIALASYSLPDEQILLSAVVKSLVERPVRVTSACLTRGEDVIDVALDGTDSNVRATLRPRDEIAFAHCISAAGHHHAGRQYELRLAYEVAGEEPIAPLAWGWDLLIVTPEVHYDVIVSHGIAGTIGDVISLDVSIRSRQEVDTRVAFAVHAEPTDWLVIGRSRSTLSIEAGGTVTFTSALVPLRAGWISLPRIIPVSPSIKVHYERGVERVRVLPPATSTTWAKEVGALSTDATPGA